MCAVAMLNFDQGGDITAFFISYSSSTPEQFRKKFGNCVNY